MRRTILELVVVGSAMTSWGGCGGDDLGPLYVDTQYQMRCIDIGMCSGVPARDIQVLNGQEGFRVSCNASPVGDGMRVDFSAVTNMAGTCGLPCEMAPYGIAMTNLQFRPESGVITGMPIVDITEDGNDYRGSASASPPADTCHDTDASTDCPNECQITGINLEPLDKGTRLSMQVFCESLALTTDPPRQREVTSPSSTTAPFNLTIENCPGL